MSGFERALLEGKERDELVQIAESLGKKPPARAKKSTVIDLILELAGVTPVDAGAPAEAAASAESSVAAAEDASEDAGAPESSSDAEGESGAAADAESSAADAESFAVDAEAEGSGADAGAGTDAGADAASASGPSERQGGRDGQGRSRRGRDGGRGGQEGRGAGSSNGAQGADTSAGDAEVDPNAAPSAEQPHQNPNHQPAQNDEEADGNRRRRRRGRNRDGQAGDAFEGEPVEVEGVLDLREDGYGFLRVKGFLPSAADVYVSVKQVRQLGLRKGDVVTGKSRPASRNEKNPALLQIDAVNGDDPATAAERRRFDDLTPLFPDERLTLETSDSNNTTTRIIDLMSPIGKGQRGLIVAPPKAGKTTIIKQIARSIESNHPDVELVVLLVDERPEEVTDMRRWLTRGEVVSSTFDRPSEEHISVAELVIERAKRRVEAGRDVVVILDGITRLARAYNLAQPPSGRIMSGGIDAGALYPPKRFFGAARNAEEGGSLTIIATALVETGSKMDEHIFEEFKGTGNMELRLDRHLAERRIFPAIDVDASSTRHEELLFEKRQVPQVAKLRTVLGALKDGEGASDAAAMNLLLDRMRQFKTNADFLAEIAKASAAG